MPARHYDVILLGRSIGTLLTAALLARRELRVLVLGQGQAAPLYRIEKLPLARRAFTMLSATSPAFRRVLNELAQSQRFKQLTRPLDPMFALLDGELRFEIPPDVELFKREISREFAEIQQPIAELYTQISSVNAQVDAAFDKDTLWPPGTLFERLETGRLASQLPSPGPTSDLLARMPEGHRFQHVVELPAVFSSHLGIDASALDSLSVARLHGSWTRGVHSLPRGEQDLEDFLVARIEASGGACRLGGRADEIVIQRGRVVGVIEDGEESPTAAEAIVTNLTGESLAELSGGAGVTKKARDQWPRIDVVGARFVTSLIVDDAGLPEPLPRESFVLASDSTLPHVHLQRLNLAAFMPPPAEDDPPLERSLLVAEILLPEVGGVHLLGARQATLTALTSYLPFLEEHLVLVDSPYDGLPAWNYTRDGRGKNHRKEIERIHLRGVSPRAEAMDPRFIVSPPGYLGLAGEPLRGPIVGTYLVGPSVLPALGQEGEVLAAWGVAKLLTKKDKSRQKLRTQMWTKIEPN